MSFSFLTYLTQVYSRMLEELGNELCYAFGGCTILVTSGKYRSTGGAILPDKVNLLFSDTPFLWERDRLIVEQYAERVRSAVQGALTQEESILAAFYPVYHAE